MSTLASRLHEAMKAARISQVELARMASTTRSKVTQQSIQQILAGRNLTSKHTGALARALGVSFEWLAEGQGSKTPGAPNPATYEKNDADRALNQPQKIDLPVYLPNVLQLNEMFEAMLEAAGHKDSEGELAQKLARLFPNALRRTIAAGARSRRAAGNILDAAVPHRAKHPAGHPQRQRT